MILLDKMKECSSGIEPVFDPPETTIEEDAIEGELQLQLGENVHNNNNIQQNLAVFQNLIYEASAALLHQQQNPNTPDIEQIITEKCVNLALFLAHGLPTIGITGMFANDIVFNIITNVTETIAALPLFHQYAAAYNQSDSTIMDSVGDSVNENQINSPDIPNQFS